MLFPAAAANVPFLRILGFNFAPAGAKGNQDLLVGIVTRKASVNDKS